MKKILLLSQFFYPDLSGTGKILAELCRGLSLRGYTIDVAASRQEFGKKQAMLLSTFQSWEGINIYRSCKWFGNKDKTIGRIYNYLAVFLCTLICCTRNKLYKDKDILISVSNPPIMPLIGLLLKSNNQKFYYLIHDLYPDIAIAMNVVSEKHIFSRVMYFINNYIFKHADGIVVLGRDMSDYLQKIYNISDDKIHIIANWGSESLLEIQAKQRQKKFRIVYSGNMGRFHNLELAAEAIKKRDDIEMIFVGEGQAKHELQQRYRPYSNIIFMTYLDETAYIDMLKTADALLVSLEKNLSGLAVPSKFYTYLGAGRPILCIADDDTEIAMLIKEHNCGFVIPHDSVDYFSECCDKLIKQQSLCEKMGNEARKAFLKSYRLDLIIEKYEELFESK